MAVIDRISAYVEQHRIIKPGAPILLGVSGGADSVCLLDCMFKLGYDILVAHIDHQLRAESGDEAAFVKDLTIQYGVPFIETKGDVGSVMAEGHSLEEAARIVRYSFLIHTAEAHGIRLIGTGHTADDQVETILMHFLRGAGPSGLRGMLPSTKLDDLHDLPKAPDLVLFRPLLGISRAETSKHCQTIGVEPISDPSNLDLRLHRNRIRHHLLPMLETYNPQIRSNILRMGEIMRMQADLLQYEGKKHLQEILSEAEDQALLLDRENFLRQHPAMQRVLLRYAIQTLVPDLRDIGYMVIDRGVGFIQSYPKSTGLTLVGGLELRGFGEDILLKNIDQSLVLSSYPQVENNDATSMNIPGEFALANGWRIVSSIYDAPKEFEWETFDQNRVVVDRGVLGDEVMVRASVPGDRIRPLGFDGHQKLSDIFINQGVPQLVRERWPLMISYGKPAWLVGIRLSHDFRVTKDTSHVVQFRLVSPD